MRGIFLVRGVLFSLSAPSVGRNTTCFAFNVTGACTQEPSPYFSRVAFSITRNKNKQKTKVTPLIALKTTCRFLGGIFCMLFPCRRAPAHLYDTLKYNGLSSSNTSDLRRQGEARTEGNLDLMRHYRLRSFMHGPWYARSFRTMDYVCPLGCVRAFSPHASVLHAKTPHSATFRLHAYSHRKFAVQSSEVSPM